MSNDDMPKNQNRGTGAGGANTNRNGKAFEEKTDNTPWLLLNGFERKQIPGKGGKHSSYLEKLTSDGSIVFLKQDALRLYFEWKFKIELFRKPDEAYLIKHGDTYSLKVLEKKNQNVEGSVDTKLLAGPLFIEEYQECLGPNFKVYYAFCISEFLQNKVLGPEKRYLILRKLLTIHGIPLLFGDDENYQDTLKHWLNM